MNKSIFLSIIACGFISLGLCACKGQTTVRANPQEQVFSNTQAIDKNKQTIATKQTIILDDATKEYNATLNNELYYTHEIHASVGKSYSAEYDTTAFELRSAMKYDNPESGRAGLCGGDRGEKTSIFIPRKTGNYEIKIYHNFRDQITDSLTFKVTIL